MKEVTRARLIDTAAELFYERGIHATGIDLIVERSGLAKPTLYQHFRSKEQLATAVIEQWSARREEILRAIIDDSTKTPDQRLRNVFRYYEEWFRGDGYRGCGLVNSSLEFANPRAASRLVIEAHKNWVVNELTALARAAILKSPERLAESLAALIEGATVMAHVRPESHAGRNLLYAADKLISAHRPG